MTVEGFTFDSKPEAARWLELREMERAGLITNLQWDKKLLRLPVVINGQLIFHYTPDFRYMRGGVRVVEDIKSEYTAGFREWKRTKKILKALYNLDVVEVIRGKKRGNRPPGPGPRRVPQGDGAGAGG